MAKAPADTKDEKKECSRCKAKLEGKKICPNCGAHANWEN